ncbi:MAG: AbrB/MazE/SpoVT family DNA-binding domain-containing protein [Chloroflexi bacterium]|nr:AbrB/MazE/SpoVT family DNA-binding domain-containing protein [Chloroflexota bacterium]
MADDMLDRRLVRLKQKGQLTLPAAMRRDLGIKEGDLVEVTRTPDGLLITPQETIAARDIDEADRLLKEQGLSLDEIIEHGRSIRGRLIKEAYGIDTDQ